MSTRVWTLGALAFLLGCHHGGAKVDGGDAARDDAPGDHPSGGNAPTGDASPSADAPVETTAPDARADGGAPEHAASADADGLPMTGVDAAAPDDGPLTDAGYDALVVKNFWPGSIPVMAAARAPASAGDPVCYASGWCWSDPSPLGGKLGVWALAANDVWVVGPHGTARHFDGQTWTNTVTSTTTDLKAVWGSASDAVFAAGDSLVLRWDGGKWKVVDDVGGGGDSLSGRGPDDFWMGQSNNNGGASHFNGKTWDAFVSGPTFDVFETADGAFYGSIGQDLAEIQPGGDGKPQLLDSKGGFNANGVWAASRTDVWQVHPAALMRFDDTQWRNVLQLAIDIWTPQLQQVRGSDASHVWVSAIDGSMLRWNGTGLERWPSGAKHAEHISARTTDDVWMSGWSGTVSHFDGQAWQRQGSGAQLLDIEVMGTAGDEVWVLGDDMAGEKIMRRRADGTWQEVPNGFPFMFFGGVWGAGPNDVWVTGAERAVDGAPVLAHWDGAGWSRARGLPATGGYGAVWGTASDDVWTVGADLRHWDGAAWTVVKVPGETMTTWGNVKGSSKTDVWVNGSSPTGERLFQWNGTSWTLRPSPPTESGGLAVRAPNDVFMWTDAKVQHFDGKTWSTLLEAGPNVGDTGDVSVRAGEVWRAQINGAVSVWNGKVWTPSDTFSVGCSDVLATAHDVWVGCSFEGAGVLHLPR